MTVEVRWPDGRVERCYSPSLVMHDHLESGATYPVGDFTRRALHALARASERVRARYGYACTSAAATAEQIRRSAAGFDDDQPVLVVSLWPPLSPPESPSVSEESP